jgi:dihydropteroate synthase
MPRPASLETLKGTIVFDRTRLMGVLNLTPDSFFDGGVHDGAERGYARGMELEQQGADILDVGGESTRPGSLPVTAEEESRRVLPVLERLARRLSIPISIDTNKAAVASRAFEAGASMLNDVTALRNDPGMGPLVAARKAPVILMHALWPPATMQSAPEYVDVVEDVRAFLHSRAAFAQQCGVARERIVLDPGIGFGKTLEHNLELLRELPRLLSLGHAILVGPSRKSFVGAILDQPASARLWGTAGAVALCAAAGAQLVRVHDVAEMRDVVRVVDAVTRPV